VTIGEIRERLGEIMSHRHQRAHQQRCNDCF
jgi:hypothetical protein